MESIGVLLQKNTRELSNSSSIDMSGELIEQSEEDKKYLSNQVREEILERYQLFVGHSKVFGKPYGYNK